MRQPLWLTVICAFCLVYVVADNMGSVARSPVKVPASIAPLGQLFHIHQNWRMFAPSPIRVYSWYVVVGKLSDGREIDLWTGKSVSWEKPTTPIPWQQNYRWRTYMKYLGSEKQRSLRPYFSNYVCRKWNENLLSGEAVQQLALYRLDERISLDGSPQEIQKTTLWQQSCASTPQPDAGSVY